MTISHLKTPKSSFLSKCIVLYTFETSFLPYLIIRNRLKFIQIKIKNIRLNKNRFFTNTIIEAWGWPLQTRLDASADRDRGCGTTAKKKNFVAIPWRTRLLLVRQSREIISQVESYWLYFIIRIKSKNIQKKKNAEWSERGSPLCLSPASERFAPAGLF